MSGTNTRTGSHVFSFPQGLEAEALKAILVGKLKEAFLLEELLENEIIRANLDLTGETEKVKRSVDLQEVISRRQKRASDFFSGVPGVRASDTPVAENYSRTIPPSNSSLTKLQAADDDDNGGFSGFSLLSNVLATSSAVSEIKQTKTFHKVNLAQRTTNYAILDD